jgi:hypothetical protein
MVSVLNRRCWISVPTSLTRTLALAGCTSGLKPVHPIRGKVLFRGKPADSALVVLNPVGETDTKAVRPQGTVSKDGVFEISTYGEKNGAPAGDYAVSFVWLIEDARTKREWSPLPVRFMNPAQSGVKVTIREGSNELASIQLTR